MPGIADDLKLRFGPGSMQLPGAHHRTHDVIPTLDDYRRNVTNFTDIFNQIVVTLKERIVDEVVTLNKRQRQGEVCLTGMIYQLLVRKEL